jgi:hypothetical protein
MKSKGDRRAGGRKATDEHEEGVEVGKLSGSDRADHAGTDALGLFTTNDLRHSYIGRCVSVQFSSV